MADLATIANKDPAPRTIWPGPARGPRVLIYSHDTFGLGHLRRSRALANAIVGDHADASVVIISGSPVIGNFEFGSGVDYIRIPGVTKLPDGDYRTLNLNVSLDEAVGLRQALILQTAKAFQPDVFIVDKEPTGFRGEVVPALDYLQAVGCRLVLGIRDVMDEPALLIPEWERKGAREALIRYYDEIWVYGLKDVHQPLQAFDLPEEVSRRITYTGYLRREIPPTPSLTKYPKITKQPFILVTTGGGGDGDDLIDWVISAYEADQTLEQPALILFGPFIDRDTRRAFVERIAKQPKLDVMSFDNKIERLMKKADAIVAMGGYNTFCEALSFDKRTLIVPRTKPRLEQYIRAVEAERLGLVRMLSDHNEPRTPERMAAALKALSSQPRPSEVTIPGLLDGLDRVQERLKALTKSAIQLTPAYHQAAE
ncbi:glycosyltransferase family protein [Microvirga guangxiensis]|uniref:Predicted glycosyl transferase n=1 Tax=Microvirga guangxiensis TaxID=549386 RepID=A0A1G5C9X9_9HYPH|nr:glycosyltransferase [Microvirga guangxiensis]SCX99120.1 Predicted glycosyl transferase [Microvirga guangxiensis]